MGWNAKPSGSYTFSTQEGKENVVEMNAFFNNNGFTLEAQAGIIGNSMAESGLNPWRWEGDSVNLSGGYGLFQFTPASGYINGQTGLEYFAPNMSTTSVTAGADPRDGEAQLYALVNDTLGKWVRTCWRPYWSIESHPNEYALRNKILTEYGDGAHLSLSDYKRITDVREATFAFLACYEGPGNLILDPRVSNANIAYELLSGEPVPPAPTKRKSMPVWMMIRPF